MRTDQSKEPIPILVPLSVLPRKAANHVNMAMENVFAVVRWLNDNNRLSVHNSKYFLGSKKKENYTPGDEGIACYPGFPGKWNFRVIAVGGKHPKMAAFSILIF